MRERDQDLPEHFSRMSPAPSDDPFFLDDPEYLHSPAHTRSPFDAAFDSPFSDPAQDPAPLMNPNLGPGFRGLGVCAKSLPDWAHADSLLGSHRPVVQRLGPGRVRVEFDSRRFICLLYTSPSPRDS